MKTIDTRFGQSLHFSSDKDIRTLLKTDPAAAWSLWCERTQKRNLTIAPSAPERRSLWAIAGSETFDRIQSFGPHDRKALLKVERELSVASCNEAVGLSLINFLWRLGLEPDLLEAGEWFDILEALLGLIAGESLRACEEDPLIHQIFAGEIPWMLGVFFPDIKQTRTAVAAAQGVMQEGLIGLLDGGGLPHATDFSLLRPLLASWTRVLDLARHIDKRPWNAAARMQYEWAVQQSLRFCRADGSSCLDTVHEEHLSKGSLPDAPECPVARFREMIEVALSLDTDSQDTDIALFVLPKCRRLHGRCRKQIDPKTLPQESYFSDWAGMAVLRSGWKHSEPSLIVSYAGEEHSQMPEQKMGIIPFGGWTDAQTSLELNLHGVSLISGACGTRISIDSRPLHPEGDWTPICSEIEQKYDYLEIERPLSRGFRLQRHFLLAHDDAVLLLADTLLPNDETADFAGGNLEYEWSLPLTPRLCIECDQEMPGLFFSIKDNHPGKSIASAKTLQPSPLAHLLPLALSESFDVESSQGELSIDGNRLIHRLWGCGRALYAPLFFDLSGSRLKMPAFWRHLTVGENLERVSRDRAIGYRIQLGRQQFLLYRSLTATTNRSVLSRNLISDLYFGRFHPGSGFEEVLEVIAEEE